jgi:hypothetical protein
MNNGVFNTFRSRRIELNTPLNNTILFWICNLLNTHYGCCARCVCCKCCIRCGCFFRYRLNSCFKVKFVLLLIRMLEKRDPFY